MKESLSALMDGELSEHEQAQLLADLARDPQLARVWERYHLIRAALRKELGPMMFGGLTEQVSRDISDTSAGSVGVSPPQRRRSVVRWAGGLELAASVAATAILSVQWLQPGESDTQPAQVAIVPVTPTKGMSAGMTRWDAGEPEVTHLLNTYLVEHNETMPTADMKGVMTYGRFVGYDEKQ
ncbi:MAG: sigma-E factor negative regulatory protein [Acidiferrobacterales bacterium]|nr:sigma-E factor negative regulatory protein [Acidiferrobacterales bacterium]